MLNSVTVCQLASGAVILGSVATVPQAHGQGLPVRGAFQLFDTV